MVVVDDDPITYRPRVCNPEVDLIAEINPRFTNWTLSVLEVMTALGLPPTVESLLRVASGDEYKVLARDAWPMPENVTVDRARGELLELHRELMVYGGGIILKMPDRKAGITAWSNGHVGCPNVNEIYQLALSRLASAVEIS